MVSRKFLDMLLAIVIVRLIKPVKLERYQRKNKMASTFNSELRFCAFYIIEVFPQSQKNKFILKSMIKLLI